MIWEGGGLTSSDGPGGMLGLGFGLIQPRLGFVRPGTLGFIYRHTWTTKEQRDDLSLDLVFPIW